MAKRSFLDLYSKKRPTLEVKYARDSDEIPTIVTIENILINQSNAKDLRYIETICKDAKLIDFLKFYTTYNGFEIGIPINPENCRKQSLIRQVPAEQIKEFTGQYLPGGKWAWTIDLNKSSKLYRSSSSWIAFAEVETGPACLTIFLEGPYTGCVFLVTPQPHFNILKPIAKSYNLLIDRLAEDPAAFFRLIRAYVGIKKKDGFYYGYVPMEYKD